MSQPPTGPGMPEPGRQPAHARRPEADPRSGDKPPHTVRRAITLFTLIGAMLVFFAVLSFSQLDGLVREGKKLLNEADPALAAQLSSQMIRSVLIGVFVLMVVIAIGAGLTAQGLRDRKSWARPLGFTFGGILLAFSGLSLIGGALSFQTLVFGFAGLWGILLLARPEVRDYLKPWPPNRADASSGGSQ